MFHFYDGTMEDERKYADRREELIKAFARRRRKIKEMAIAYKGGACQICGYSKCILLCANCHRELEAGVTQLPEVIQVEKTR